MKIYIVLTDTGTLLGKIIKFYTRDRFSHVSISLDIALTKMYSFGRLKPYNPFIGGFVHEYIDKGTFKRFNNTKAKIIELDVNEEQYEKLYRIIEYMEANKTIYKFNIIGLFAVALNLKITIRNSFYCAEFIKYLMEKSNINIKLPEIVRPESFNSICFSREIYSGFLRDYNNYIHSQKIEKINII